MSTGFLQVTTTIDSPEEASALARAVVEARLAACAQVSGPIDSTYWWEGELDTDREWVCSMKTTEKLFEALARFVTENHSYETPEIIATPITANREYLEWITAETSST
ncbi:MAG: divalent-cation tolerance protein CutA [Actinomycetota bacterium]